MIDYTKKDYKIAAIALIFAIIGWILPGATTNESVFQIEINNTNLAPTVAGETNGTGERVQGITYYANNTPIELFLWGHAQNVSQTAEMHLFINGTKVSDTSGRALGVAEQSNKTIVAIIPRYASYMVEVRNTHHYEWREYKVISGQNGSVNISNNYYNSSCSGCVNQTQLNEKLNKTGDFIYGALVGIIGNTTCTIDISTVPTGISCSNATRASTIAVSPDEIIINTGDGAPHGLAIQENNIIIDSDINMSNKNITNCANCSEFSKLIKTTSYLNGSVMTGSTTIPHDDTIPQITEGNLFGNVTITPASTNSKIKVCSQIMLSTSAVNPNLLQIVLFIGNSSNASATSSAYSPAQFFEVNTGVCYTTQVPGTTPFNVSVRYGSNAAGTVTVNGANTARQYGGVYNSYIIVDEYKD